MDRFLPAVMRIPGFRLYWSGIAIAYIGMRATVTANLWQILELTDSTLLVGLVGLFEGIALLVLAPLGGALADRFDRRRLVQMMQGLMVVVTSTLSLLTFTGLLEVWHIYLAVTIISAGHTFDDPARVSLIPALVPRDRLVDAFAIASPAREMGMFIGPAIAGFMIAFAGAGSVYLVTALSNIVLIVILGLLVIPRIPPPPVRPSLLRSIAEGFSYVRARPLFWQLMGMDFTMTFFAAYRVLMPAFARDILQVGPEGYGLLLSAPAVGAVTGSAVTFRLRGIARKGWLSLAGTGLYGITAVILAQSGFFAMALAAAFALGFFDAVTAIVRRALIHAETSEEVRGRVSSLTQMVSRGGPALGQAQMGALASLLTPPVALTLGGLVPLLTATGLAVFGRTVRGHRG